MDVSIIIPVYNGENYIRKCIDSIVHEIKSNIEVIIINDGSNDNTGNICDEYSIKYPFIKVIHKKNEGVSVARNVGIKEASGKYIMFLDADDYLSKDWYEVIKKDLNNNYDIVYYCNCEIDYNMKKEKVIEEITCLNGKSNYFAAPFSKLFKKEKIGNLTFPDKLNNGEDMLFNLEMILKTDNYYISNKSFYNYRVYNGSLTKSFNPKIVSSDKEFHKQLERILSLSNLNENLKNDIKNCCLRGGVLALVSRFSYIKKYSEAKKLFKILEEAPYKSIIEKTKYFEINKKLALILLLCKFRLYYILFIALKMFSKVKYKGNKAENFLKI